MQLIKFSSYIIQFPFLTISLGLIKTLPFYQFQLNLLLLETEELYFLLFAKINL